MSPQAATEAPRPKVPIGIPSIDRRLNGGVRKGTTLLVTGPFGTGYQEFLRTAAVLHGNWQTESGLFELEYGEVPATVTRPSQIRYIALNDTETAFRRHIHDIAANDIAYPALEGIEFHSISASIAELGPITPEDGGFRHKTAEERMSDAYQSVFEEFDQLIEGISDEIVIIESLSDFFPVTAKFLDPADIYFIAQTLCHVVSESDSVLIAGADEELLQHNEAGLLKRSFEGVLDFGWLGEGTARRRTMTVTKFPEFWRESNDDETTMFDLDIDRERFGISSVKKIPPSR
ncbi:RAD55 family ATPase [Haloglomus litoreum]|uniref:RAD55 family ATPase n=1 Tax=Haloglomus litoreum TaxID=3034026 RepID=UPI0023E7BE16|nr:hypothetical protein [Haloglomus sp. DT116]